MTVDFSIGSDHWPGTSKLVEECGELLEVLGKIMGSEDGLHSWEGVDLRSRVEEEIADVIAACDFFAEFNSLNADRIRTRVTRKRELFNEWHDRWSAVDPPDTERSARARDTIRDDENGSELPSPAELMGEHLESD